MNGTEVSILKKSLQPNFNSNAKLYRVQLQISPFQPKCFYYFCCTVAYNVLGIPILALGSSKLIGAKE